MFILFVYLFIYLFIYLFVHLFAYSYIYLFKQNLFVQISCRYCTKVPELKVIKT